MPESLGPLLVQGGAVSAMALFCWRLLRTMLRQADANAARWQAAAEAADKRADESVRLIGEVLQVMRGVEAPIRDFAARLHSVETSVETLIRRPHQHPGQDAA